MCGRWWQGTCKFSFKDDKPDFCSMCTLPTHQHPDERDGVRRHEAEGQHRPRDLEVEEGGGGGEGEEEARHRRGGQGGAGHHSAAEHVGEDGAHQAAEGGEDHEQDLREAEEETRYEAAASVYIAAKIKMAEGGGGKSGKKLLLQTQTDVFKVHDNCHN